MKRKHIVQFLKLGVTALILYLIFKKFHIGWGDITGAIAQSNPWWFLASFGTQLFAITFSVLRWNVLLRAQDLVLPFGHLVKTFLVGRFLGTFTPTGVGLEAYKAYDVARYTGRVTESVAVVFIEKAIGTFFALGLLALLTLPLFAAYLKVLYLLLPFFAVLLVMALVLLFKPGLIESILRLNVPLKEKIEGPLRNAVRAFTIYSERKGSLVAAVFFGFGMYLSLFLTYYTNARALHAGLGVVDVLLVCPLTQITTMLPVTIAGVGLREMSFVGLLDARGVTFVAASATLAATMWYFVSVAINGVGAMIFLTRRTDYKERFSREQVDSVLRASAEGSGELPVEGAAGRAETGPVSPGRGDGSGGGTGSSAAVHLWLGLCSAAAAGALVGAAEGGVVLAGREGASPGVILYGEVMYALIALMPGLALGVAGALVYAFWGIGQEKGRAASLYFCATLAPMGLVIVRFRILRDLFHEKLRLASAMGVGVHLALLVGAVLLFFALHRLVLSPLFARLARSDRPALRRMSGAAGMPILLVVFLATGGLIAAGSGGGGSSHVGGDSPVVEADGPNIIFIGIDTLRADRLGCYNAEVSWTPSMDRLAGEGVRFEDAIAQASWTKPSFATIFTSLYPSSHQAIRKPDILPDEVVTLAEVLGEAGYLTAGFVNNVNITSIFNFDQGFHTYAFLEPDFFFGADEAAAQLSLYNMARLVRERFLSHKTEVRHYYRDAETVNEHAIPWIEAHQEERFFLFVHYMDPHDPYFHHPYDGVGYARVHRPRPPAALAAEYAGTYDAEVAYMDAWIGALLDRLRSLGLYRDALIVLSSDHGEEFFEHGGWWHGTTLYDEQVRVPLIIKLPGDGEGGAPGKNGRVRRDQARLLDIAPTLAAAAGLGAPETWQGEDLFAPGAEAGGGREWAFSEEDHEGNVLRSTRTRVWKLILANPGNPRGLESTELYRLAADPGEQENLAGADPHRDVLRELHSRTEEIEQLALEASVGAVQTEMDDATRERLKALGYIE